MMVCGIKCRIFFFKQKTAYEMRISDWSSDVCSSDLEGKKTDSRLLFVYSNAPQNVIVRNDSGVKSLADLKGKRFNPGLKGSATEKTAATGRASGRERVCQIGYVSVVRLPVNKKQHP